jgi:hypothetical protein
MESYSPFWVIPIILCFWTWIGIGLAVMARDGDFPLLCILALAAIAAAHVFITYNTSSLHRVNLMPYYEALEMYGKWYHHLFNYGLLGIEVLMYFVTCLHCLRIINIDHARKS